MSRGNRCDGLKTHDMALAGEGPMFVTWNLCSLSPQRKWRKWFLFDNSQIANRSCTSQEASCYQVKLILLFLFIKNKRSWWSGFNEYLVMTLPLSCWTLRIFLSQKPVTGSVLDSQGWEMLQRVGRLPKFHVISPALKSRTPNLCSTPVEQTGE